MQYFRKSKPRKWKKMLFFRKFILNIFLKEGEKLYICSPKKLRYKYNNNYLAK